MAAVNAFSLQTLQTLLKKPLNSLQKNEHRPIDLLVAAVAFILLFAMSTMVSNAEVPNWEIQTFRAINNLPDWLFPIVWPFMQYGVFATIPVVAALALYFKRVRLALLLLVGGVGIYYLARYIKVVVPRGRPGALIDNIHARETFAPFSSGFTSGHTAVAATIATFAHHYLSKNWQLLSIFTLTIVVFGRIYIGGHLPLDVLGGVALGVGVASLINFLVGLPQVKVVKEEDTKDWIAAHRPRHPGDIIRMGLAVIVFAASTALAFGGQISNLEEAAFRVVNYLPSFMSPLLQLIMQAGALYFVFIAAATTFALKHHRLAAKILFGGVVVWWLAKVAKCMVDRERPLFILSDFIDRAGSTGLGFPSGHAAVAALLATVTSPYLPKPWRRVVWSTAWIVALSRLYVGAHFPLDIIAGLSLGWFFGSLLNFAFGTPAKKLPIIAIKARLADSAMAVAHLEQPTLDARGSTPLFATTTTGKNIFIKYVDNERRNADMLFRLWRFITLRQAEDEAPFATAKHITEHEAYVAMQAALAGARVPEVLTATSVTSHSAMIVSQRIFGTILSAFSRKIDAKLLRDIWRQVELLHKQRIAHRDLRTANILIDSKRRPWLIDFGFSVTSASEQQMRQDCIELLVSTAMLTSPDQAVDAAIKTIGVDSIKTWPPYLQPLALTATTRKQLGAHPLLLQQLTNQIQTLTNSRGGKAARMQRLDQKWLAMVIIIGLSLAFLLPKIAEFHLSPATLWDADSKWLLACLLASFATYLASAFVVIGSTNKPLPYGSTLLLQAATSAVNRITPKGLGGIVLTEHFLEKHGLTRLEATASITFIYAYGFMMHLLLLLVTIVMVDYRDIDLFNLTTSQTTLITILGVTVLLGILNIPRVNKLAKSWWAELRKGIYSGIHNPLKLLQLVGGSAGVTLLYTMALYSSLEAYGSAVPFGIVLLAYLGGSAVSSAAPTPGGLGAIELALVVGITAAGLPIDQTVAGVLVYRLLTFWLPIVPGFIALRILSRDMYAP